MKVFDPIVILKVRRNVENPLSTRIQHRIAKLQSNTTCPPIFKVNDDSSSRFDFKTDCDKPILASPHIYHIKFKNVSSEIPTFLAVK